PPGATLFPCTTLFRSGQSQLAAYKVGMAAAGGELTQVIPIPQNETNMTPYISKIATDGSVNGLINTEEMYGVMLVSFCGIGMTRSEEHTSELQSREKL